MDCDSNQHLPAQLCDVERQSQRSLPACFMFITKRASSSYPPRSQDSTLIMSRSNFAEQQRPRSYPTQAHTKHFSAREAAQQRLLSPRICVRIRSYSLLSLVRGKSNVNPSSIQLLICLIGLIFSFKRHLCLLFLLPDFFSASSACSRSSIGARTTLLSAIDVAATLSMSFTGHLHGSNWSRRSIGRSTTSVSLLEVPSMLSISSSGHLQPRVRSRCSIGT